MTVPLAIDEVELGALDQVLRLMLRGGDPRVLGRSEQLRGLRTKVQELPPGPVAIEVAVSTPPPRTPPIQPRPPAPAARETTEMRNPKTYTYDGRTLTIGQWAKEPEAVQAGLTPQALRSRLKARWPFATALTTPKGGEPPKAQKAARAKKRAAKPKRKPPSKTAQTTEELGRQLRDELDGGAQGHRVALRIGLFVNDLEVASSTDLDHWLQTAELVRGGA